MTRLAALAVVAMVFALAGFTADVEAAVTPLDAWPSTPQLTGTGNLSGSFSVSAGANRVLIVAVGSYDSGGSAGQTFTATYGGQALTEISLESSNRRQSWVGYLDEAGIQAASGTTVAVTVSGTTTGTSAFVASYEGVDQGTPISGFSNLYVNNTNNVAIGSPFNVTQDGYAIYNWSGTSGTTRTSDDEGFTEHADVTSGGVNVGVASRTVTADGTSNPTITWSANIRCSVSVFGLNPLSCIDTNGSSVTLTDPTNGATVSGSIAIATTLNNAATVEYSIDGGAWISDLTLWNTLNTHPASASAPVAGVTIDVRAIEDECGGYVTDSITVTVDNTCSEAQPSVIWTAQSSAAGDFSGVPFVTLTNINSGTMEYQVTEGSMSPPFTTLTDDYTGKATTSTDFTGLNWQPANSSEALMSWCTLTTASASGSTLSNAGNPVPMIYLESSSSGQTCAAGISATSENYLESPVLDGDAYYYTVSFDYNMEVSSASAELRVDVWDSVNGWVNNVMPVATGNQGTTWQSTGSLDFTNYINTNGITGNIQFRITAIPGATVTGDIGIDNIVLSGTPRSAETTVIPWTADPIPGMANLTNGNTYNLYARGLSNTCGVAYYGDSVANNVTPGNATTFTWTACIEGRSVSLDALTNPITGSVNVTATTTGGVPDLLVGDTTPPTQTSGWLYNPPQDDNTSTVTFYAQGTGTCATLTDSVTYNISTMQAPTVDAFVVPATVIDTVAPLTVPVTTFTASDNLAVTDYMITESGLPDGVWSATPPASYDVQAGYGSYTLYAWARDAAGNVSLAATDTVDVSDCIETATVNLDTVPNPITGATAVTATLGGTGGSVPQVSFDGGSSWQVSGSTYTPQAQAHYTLQFAARATGFCGSYIYDSANPTDVNIDARTLAVEPISTAAVQSGLYSIRVTFVYCGDQDGDATYQVDYRLSSGGPWVNGTATQDADNDGSYIVVIPGLTNGETYDVRMTVDDPDGVSEVNITAITTTVVTLVAWSDNDLLHNSNRFTGTSKHGGNWGKPGTYAGAIVCATCHAKNTGNIKRVQNTISFPDGTNMPNGAASTTVSLQSAVDGSSDFGDDSAAPRASSNKVCEVCHTYDAAQSVGVKQHAADQSVAANHYDNSDCVKCHQHKVGFKADCTACHGNPPTVNTLGGPNGLDNSVGTGSTTAGKHDLHVNTLLYGCNTCHTGWETSGEMPKAGDVNLGFNIVLGSTTDTTGDYDGRAAGAYTLNAGTTNGAGGTLTCSAVYCHGTSSPKWLDTEPVMACGSCHGVATLGYPSETAGDGDLSGAVIGKKVGKHVKHAPKYGCTLCHNGAGYGTTLHVDGTNNIIFSAAAGGSATYDYGTSTCSNLSCHGDQVWDTATPALNCDSCHGYPPTSSADAANNRHVGVTPVNHDIASDGVTTAITGNHEECNTCHGKSSTNGLTDNTAAGGDVYLASYHLDNNIEMNGWATDSGTDTQYNQTTTGCAKACHADDAAHQLSDSGMTVQLHRYGSGSCNACHDTGKGGAPIVSAASSHVDADGAGGTYTAGTCEDCHPGGTRGVLHAKNGDANVVAIANNATLNIAYVHEVDTGVNGFVLGGDATSGTSEAEICWNCHITNGVSEWAANTQTATGSSPYNYGNLSTPNWTTATWNSSRSEFAYKTGAIQSTHSANPAPDYPLGTVSGSAYSRTETPDDVRDIRCSYCHDVHELAQSPGDTKAGKPYLRGTWMGNPYEEDGAPRAAYAGTSYYPTTFYYPSTATTYRTYGFGAVPRGSTRQNVIGGYWIDQNNVTPMSATTTNQTTADGNGNQMPTYQALNPTAGWSGPDVFAGLCALCHGGGDASWTATEIDNIDQVSSEGFWVGGGNGHANSVKGGTGSTSANSANIFTARNGSTTMNAHNPYQHYQGQSQPGDKGNYGFRGPDATPRYNPPTTSSRGYGYGTDEWVIDETGATKEDRYHKFSCSKCHNPHASRLPKLMITNCLDTVHNTWDNQFQLNAYGTQNTNTELGQWTSAQNCHRYSESNNTNTASPEYRASRVPSPSGAGAGWNNVTPWYQTGSTP